jgi:excisionase family DNA binding protein
LTGHEIGEKDGCNVASVKAKSLFSALHRRKTLTLGQLAELTEIPITTLRDQVNRGEIPGAFRSGPGKGRKWRFQRESIEQWWQDMHSFK